MRPSRIAVAAGISVLAILTIASATTLFDALQHPKVADVHVPPFVAAPAPLPTDQPPATPPPLPVATPQPPPTAAPPRTAPGRSLIGFIFPQPTHHRKHGPPGR